MAVLAYQGAALDSDTWAINYNSDAAVDFTTSSTNDEIIMTYDIGTGKTPIVNLYASADCSDLSGGAAIIVGAGNVVVATDITTNSAGAPLDTRTLKIDIDKTKIDGSNIWNTGDSSLEFCVELTLEESGEVITQE